RRRRVLSILVHKDGQVFAGFRMALRRGGRPVNEGSLENGRGIVLFENPEAVRDRAAVTIAIDPRQPRENIVGRVGNQWREVITADDAFSLQEIQEVRHLLEVRWNVWIVAPQVHVVEYKVDDPLDLTAEGIQLAPRGRGLCCGAKQCDARGRRAESSFQL